MDIALTPNYSVILFALYSHKHHRCVIFNLYVDFRQSNYWAAYTHAKNGDHVNMGKEIASFPNPVAVLNSVYGGNPTTMLHTAVYNGNVKCVESLLTLKASPTIANCYGQTAIEEGRSKGQKDIMDLLDEWGNAPALLALPIPSSPASTVASAYQQPPPAPVSPGMSVPAPCPVLQKHPSTRPPFLRLPAQHPGAALYAPTATTTPVPSSTQPPVRDMSVIRMPRDVA